jgi:hypothetical protein
MAYSPENAEIGKILTLLADRYHRLVAPEEHSLIFRARAQTSAVLVNCKKRKRTCWGRLCFHLLHQQPSERLG